MQIKRTNPTDTKVKLEISVEADLLKKHHDKALKKLSRGVKVTGFRPGKAPKELIEKQLDDNQLQSEVLDSVVQETASQALISEDVRSLGQPQVNITKFVPKETLDYTLEVDCLPEVKLADYKKLKKTLPKVTVSAKDVDEVINNLRERMAEKSPIKRGAKLGDEVVIDFEGFDDKDHPIAGGKGKDYPLMLGSKTFIPGFEEGLVGKKAGDAATIHPNFPKDYQVAALAGVKARFEVKIKTVNELKQPAADDKFAAKVGPFRSIDELKSDIKIQLQEQKTGEAIAKIKDELVEEIVTKSKFSLPEVLIDEQLQSLERDMKQNLIARGMTVDEYIKQEGFKDEDAWRKDKLRPEAERRVRIGIVLSEVAIREGIQVLQEELDQRLALMRQQYSDPSVAGQLDTPEIQREISSRMATEKTVDLLYKLSIKNS